MMSPSRIGRYEVIAELGRGAMGVVHRASDPNIGREVAIKTILLDRSDPETVKRFRREAQAAGILSHPNIVTIYDADEDKDSGIFYIAMELVKGETLQQIMAQGAMPLEQILSILEQVGEALAHAHAHQIVHRDIKPANIMIEEGRVKVMDFGVAKMRTTDATATSQVAGTPSYMAPEQVKGMRADARADIFSLGATLYEMLTGTKAFQGEHLTTIIYKVMAEEPEPPVRVNPSLHPGLNYVVSKALAKEPAQRYQSCQDFIADLKNYVAFQKQGEAVAQAARSAPAPVGMSSTGTLLLNREKLGSTAQAYPFPARQERTLVTPGLESAALAPPASGAGLLRQKKSLLAVAAMGVLAVAAGAYWHLHRAAPSPNIVPAEPMVAPAPIVPVAPAPAAPESPAPPPVLSVPERNKAVASRKSPANPPAPPRDLNPPLPAPVAGAPAQQPSAPLPGGVQSQPAQTEPAPVPPQTAGQIGQLVIHTEPEGAKILVDGKATPYHSPVVLSPLAPGKHEITVERGSERQTQEVEVLPNRPAHLNIDLRPDSKRPRR